MNPDWLPKSPPRVEKKQLLFGVKRRFDVNPYPPDKQEKATHTVLEQAAVLSAGWAA